MLTMKRFAKSMLGVTLLEIMLVLAIAAMIIVMSVRYYQSASSAQQANAALEQIQAIVAAADSLSQGTGSYSAAGVSTSTIKPLVPVGSMTSPWGAEINIGDVSASYFEIALDGVPTGVCPLIRSKLVANNHFSGSSSVGTAISDCGDSAADLSVFYIANP